MSNQPTIIRIRRGMNGFKYSACDANGYFLGNFEKLSDARKHWSVEIRRGQVKLIREIDQMPDMSKLEETKANIEKLLKALVKK